MKSKTFAVSGFALVMLLFAGACSGKRSVPAESFSSEEPRGWMSLVLRRVQAQGLNPAQASRVFAYSGVALYEAAVPGMKGRRSLSGQLNGLATVPRPASGTYDWPAAQSAAVLRVLGRLFNNSPGSLSTFAMYYGAQMSARGAAGVGKDTLARSVAFGNAVGDAIVAWSAADQFDWTRGETFKMAATVEHWVPTGTGVPKLPPAEPYWGTLRRFALASPTACDPPPPVRYSEDPSSDFYKQANIVYQTSRAMTDEQRTIAEHWADNPGQSKTPPGHWMEILTDLLVDRSMADASEAYALTGVALGDAFISCWQTKYRYQVLRPETYIRKVIDQGWFSALISPQFPEYTSGHAVSSGAAATVLRALFGDVPFTDRTKTKTTAKVATNVVAPRAFASFTAAADEAANSRVLGGIHFPMSSNNGLAQGRCIGAAVLTNVRTRDNLPVANGAEAPMIASRSGTP